MGAKVYTFKEYISAYMSRTLFACVAPDIEVAGRMCAKRIGVNPWKQPYVACGFVNRYKYL